MPRTRYSMILAVLLTCIASSATAATIGVGAITGVWSNDDPDAFVTGEGSSRIEWGTPSPTSPPAEPGQQATAKSAYVFNAAAGGFNVGTGVDFLLGTFVHENFPIVPEGCLANDIPCVLGNLDRLLQSVDLNVTVDVVLVDGFAGPGLIGSSFGFEHDETANQVNPDLSPILTCPTNGLENNAPGVNVNGCADRVTFALNLGSTQSFSVGSTDYILDITGFNAPGTGFFDTVERSENTAELFARFTPVVIPVPGTLPLLLAGFGGLAFLRRRRGI